MSLVVCMELRRLRGMMAFIRDLSVDEKRIKVKALKFGVKVKILRQRQVKAFLISYFYVKVKGLIKD